MESRWPQACEDSWAGDTRLKSTGSASPVWGQVTHLQLLIIRLQTEWERARGQERENARKREGDRDTCLIKLESPGQCQRTEHIFHSNHRISRRPGYHPAKKRCIILVHLLGSYGSRAWTGFWGDSFLYAQEIGLLRRSGDQHPHHGLKQELRNNGLRVPCVRTACIFTECTSVFWPQRFLILFEISLPALLPHRPFMETNLYSLHTQHGLLKHTAQESQ